MVPAPEIALAFELPITIEEHCKVLPAATVIAVAVPDNIIEF